MFMFVITVSLPCVSVVKLCVCIGVMEGSADSAGIRCEVIISLEDDHSRKNLCACFE